ncbi:MAG: ABC transporter ATP-binding protein [Anaerolineae bacterium]
MSDLVVETKGLTKRYGTVVAVDSLDLSVRRGEVFGLLGPNGAGKTTTILMLLGLTEPTAGTVRVLGLDPVLQPLSVKARVGYMPEQMGFYEELTARQNLFYIARLNGLGRGEAHHRIDEVLERVDLADMADRPVGTFSRGMRQRLGVAEVLLKQPQLVILDEPTQGLDPEVARRFLQMVRDLKAEGVTVLLSSHLLHQVQAVCDRVGLFHRGRMVLEGSVPELARKVLGRAYHIQVEAEGSPQALLQALERLPDAVNVVQEDGNRYRVTAHRDLRAEAAEAVVKAGGRLLGLEVEVPSLDDIYARYFQEVEHVAAT